MTVGEGSRRSSEAGESQPFPRLTTSSLLTHLQAMRRKTAAERVTKGFNLQIS